jgi:DNA-binding MarR family transcriptional regulator
VGQLGGVLLGTRVVGRQRPERDQDRDRDDAGADDEGEVVDRGAATQQDLGEKMMVDPNNLVILLNELEDAGYLVRRRDPEDRRRHIVELTDEGRRAIDHAEQGMESIEDEVLGALTPDERAKLRGLLNKALEGVPGEKL